MKNQRKKMCVAFSMGPVTLQHATSVVLRAFGGLSAPFYKASAHFGSLLYGEALSASSLLLTHKHMAINFTFYVCLLHGYLLTLISPGLEAGG